MKHLVISVTVISTIAVLVLAIPAVKKDPAKVLPQPPIRIVSRDKLLVVGSVSVKPKEEVAKFQPLADYLATRLAEHGIGKGSVAIAKSTQDMAEMFQRGEVDIYIDSPYPVAQVSNEAEVVPLLRRWKKNSKDYYSVIVVRRDSGIENVADLEGKVIAFDEEFSTAGYLLPKVELINRGAKFTELFDTSSPVPPGRVGYVFSTDDETTLFWILRRKVAAGAFSVGAYQRLAKENDNLKMLAKSIVVPRHIVVHRGNMNPDLVAELKNVLLKMDEQEEGRKVLQKFEKTTRFDDFPEGSEATFQRIQELLHVIDP